LYWGIWCFLLTQAPWTLIPERPGGSRRRHPAVNVDSFSQAHGLAEESLRGLRAAAPNCRAAFRSRKVNGCLG
ncbi:MAG: hypothetical protein ACREVH_08860, partial [Gammaproteobacteria bacterium]